MRESTLQPVTSAFVSNVSPSCAATHFSGLFTNDSGGLNNFAVYMILVLITWAVIEASALGLLGGMDNAINKLLFDDHKKTIIYGFVYWAVIFFVGWEIILKAS